MTKKRLREQARDKYRNLSEEYKNKKRDSVETDTIICLEKKNKNYKSIKKITVKF